MKITKRVLSFALCFIMMLGGYTTVYAQEENVGLTDKPEYIVENGAVSTYSTSLPTKVWNLKTKGRYNFSGHTESNTLYTNYLFTGVSKVVIYVKNNLSDENVKFQLKKDVSGINSTVSTNYVDKGKGSYTKTTVKVDAKCYYYIRFPATCNFSGYIEAAW